MQTYFSITELRKVVDSGRMFYPCPKRHVERLNPDFHDFVYMDTGYFDDIICGTERYDVIQGDVFILPAGTHHASKGECCAGTKTFYFHFLPVAGDISATDGVTASGSIGLPLNHPIHCQNNDTIRSLFEEIIHLSSSLSPQKHEMLSCLVNSLICLLHQQDSAKNMPYQGIVSHCLRIMEEMPDMLYTEDEMAELLFISSKTLRKGFLQYFGKSFYQYQLDSKLKQVCVFMREYPDMKFREIAKNLGFCDEFHMSKVFKRKYGISPSQYKKKMTATDSI